MFYGVFSSQTPAAYKTINFRPRQTYCWHAQVCSTSTGSFRHLFTSSYRQPTSILSMSQPIAPPGNPALDFYNRWSDKTPYATRVIVIGLLVEYVLSFFIPFEAYLGNTPQYTLLHFEVYRLLLAPLVGNSILTLILSLMSFPSMGSRLEWSMGTSSFLALLGTLSLATNTLFAFVCYMLYLLGSRSVLYMKCNGFWTILFSLITIECMQVKNAAFTNH